MLPHSFLPDGRFVMGGRRFCRTDVVEYRKVLQDNLKVGRNMKNYCLKIGQGRHKIFLHAVACGTDWNVAIFGGERDHIGAVACGIPTLIHGNPDRPTVSLSSFCVPGHKDDVLARKAADMLARALSQVVAVTVGIHVEQADQEDLRILCEYSLEACQRLLLRIREDGDDA